MPPDTIRHTIRVKLWGYLPIRYSIVFTRILGGRSSSGVGTWCPAPALTYSFTAKLELLTGLTALHGRIMTSFKVILAVHVCMRVYWIFGA